MAVDNSLVGGPSQLLYAAGFSALLIAAAVGALVALRRAPGSGLLVAWPVTLGLCYAPFFTQMRYRVPADPAFILLVAYVTHLTLEKSLWREGLGSLKALWRWWKVWASTVASCSPRTHTSAISVPGFRSSSVAQEKPVIARRVPVSSSSAKDAGAPAAERP